MALVYEELSNQILKAYFNVLRHLGAGLSEKLYENALCVEFEEMGIPYERQKRFSIIYKGRNIGDYIPDIVVDEKIILEPKAVPQLVRANEAQLLNYLGITGYPVGYLLNFGEGRDFKRLLGVSALH